MIPTDQKGMENQELKYLAIGDSYTIGEGVKEEERYPNQLTELLREQGLHFGETKIIAKTGWTTDELQAGITTAGIEGKQFDLVTVLIGVNNQYRGRDVEEYRQQLQELLAAAIVFAKGNKDRVLVLSIPDWGVTPFAVEKGVDQMKVSEAIDRFNAVKAETAKKMGLRYLDITNHYRMSENGQLKVVEDKLHPSKEIYNYWATSASKIIVGEMLSK
jgi:phospholipase/lecithinase/hemolysin